MIAVCCSGQGTNLQAIVGAIRARRLKARVALVVSDNPAAHAIDRAHRAGLPTVVLDPRRYPTREKFDRALAQVIDRSKAQLIVLAGFMRILSPWFVRRYRNRILNIHPALLPAFRGAHAVRDALRHGVKVTGVTVHFVDEQVDHGSILLQAPVPIRKGDTEQTLTERIHRVERQLYPKAIRQVLEGRVGVKGKKALVSLLLPLALILGCPLSAPAAEDLQLSVVPDQRAVKLSEPIEVTFKLRNRGSNALYVNRRFKLGLKTSPKDQREIYLEARAPSGKRLEPKYPGTETGFPKSEDFVLLKPGEEVVSERKWDLKSYFDFKEPGSYRLEATYQNVFGKEIGLEAWKGPQTCQVTLRLEDQ